MEKRTPHCKLPVVKSLIEPTKVRFTGSALSGAAGLGLDSSGIIDVVLTLNPRDFYKSMTTYGDHRVWQDVYKPIIPADEVCLKLTVTDDVLVVSFKEL
ncbi:MULTISPECIES: type II toxin-antitoxin system MqsR family toxin [unclassified Endozoicomonas]|uniref:type II toxin-antitoxin system MqsR family toxin n=1 Tax=unclassified Endozoicomonas TaxID=2644528 RepID=UPI003BB61069